MSDGASEGYRSAREHEARQKSIDRFFGLVLSRLAGIKVDRKDFRGAFDVFDAHRYNDSLLHGRAQKERGKRWEAFQAVLHDATSSKRMDTPVIKAWAEILTLSLRFASARVAEDLKAVSVFKEYRIGVYVPNGTGFYGKNPPTLLGDFPGALDAMVRINGVPSDAHVVVIDDPPRAVVGVTLGPDGGENLELERAKLRFLAVKAS